MSVGVDTLDLNMGAHGSHAYKTHYVIAYLHVIIRLLVSADQLSCLSHPLQVRYQYVN